MLNHRCPLTRPSCLNQSRSRKTAKRLVHLALEMTKQLAGNYGELVGNEKSGLESTEHLAGRIRCAHARFIRSRFLFLRLLAFYTNHLSLFTPFASLRLCVRFFFAFIRVNSRLFFAFFALFRGYSPLCLCAFV